MTFNIRPVNAQDEHTLNLIAKEFLEPLYGDQSKALNEWLTKQGYKETFVPTTDDQTAAGLLSLKVNPQKIYLKISTLFVLPEYQGHGFGTTMLQFAEQFAKQHGRQEIIVTISALKPESLKFFTKHCFRPVDQKLGKYQEGIVEHILRKELP